MLNLSGCEVVVKRPRKPRASSWTHFERELAPYEKNQRKKSVYDVKSAQRKSNATLVVKTRELHRRIGDRLPQLLVIVAISVSVFNKDFLIRSLLEDRCSIVMGSFGFISIWFCMVGILHLRASFLPNWCPYL